MAMRPRNFAHRFQQRQAMIDLDGFIRDGGHAGLEQGVGQAPIRRQVKCR